MENAFVYDLVTTRNPRSAFSYANYLLSQNRLVAFANSDRLNPLREEFEHYLKWCADHFQEQVRYGSEVVGIVPERSSDTVRAWKVTVKDLNGATYVVHTRNIAVPAPSSRNETKSRPLTHVNFGAGQRIISMDDYLSRRNELREPREPRLDISIVGSGQRAIEILDDLLTCSHLGNITMVTENESLSALKILGNEPSPPQPRLCSLWARPSGDAKATVSGSSELIQNIYTRAYEKQLRNERKYALRIVSGRDAGELTECSIIITENASAQLPSNKLFENVDSLALGCRQKGESLEEVQFKRGAVAEGCRMWMLSAHSEGGRSLAKDVAVRASEVVRALSEPASERDGVMMINARM